MTKASSYFCFSLLVSGALLAGLADSVLAEHTDQPKTRFTEVITIAQGSFRGVVEEDTQVFRGIPFAAPPINDRRWRSEPPQTWTGVHDCVTTGAACAQKPDLTTNLLGQGEINSYAEDCLYLNIYCPANPTRAKLPVMVWIHGGAYETGSGGMGIYHGANLVRRGAVVVTINYRLGPFGFLAHPALTAEAGSSSNYGLLDQIAALRWVQKNITAFGGDPQRVTIFGESAGAGSVVCLLVSPLTRGLFQRAILQSTPNTALRPLHQEAAGKSSAEAAGQKLIKDCGLDETADVAALRAIPAATLLAAAPSMQVKLGLPPVSQPFEPCVDGVVLPVDPTHVIAEGKQYAVPVLVGANRDEAAALLMGIRLPENKAQYEEHVRAEFGPMAERVLAGYEVSDSASAIRRQAIHLGTDLVIAAQTRRLARSVAAQSMPVYKYLFSRRPQVPLLASLGAIHAYEIPFVFGVKNPLLGWRDHDRQLSEFMQQYWVNFATTGDPNGPGLPAWPKYDGTTEPTLEFGDQVTVIEKYRAQQLDIVDELLR